MNREPLSPYDEIQDPSEDDLWFLPGPLEAEPDLLLPVPRPTEATALEEWAQAEAGLAARLARVAGRLGALDERVLRGPEGWRHRLALLEAADLSWIAGDRVAPDRLALWVSMRLSGVQDDPNTLVRIGWAVRRLTGGPAPLDDLAAFLGRRDPETRAPEAERFEDRAGAWRDLMAEATPLHPITRAALGFHLWALAGLGDQSNPTEAAVTAARLAATECRAARFAPLALAGGMGLRARGTVPERLAQWLDGMDSAILAAMRHLDGIEAWQTRASTEMARLSGRVPRDLQAVFGEWPLVSAPMAQTLTQASRAAVQRNLTWMETHGLLREVTGQGRFRMWRADI